MVRSGLPAAGNRSVVDSGQASCYQNSVSPEHFADRYIHSARRLKHPLCVGLDPYLDKIPVEFGVKPDEPASDASADGVLGFLTEVLDQCSGRVPAVKPQIAFFEQMGW